MQYLIALLVPPLVLLVGRRWASTAKRLLALAAASAALMYIAAVSVAFAMSGWYAHEADAFDTDRDGIISMAEQSQAQSEAMERSVNDAGTNMTVFLAAPISIATSSVLFAAFGIVRLTKRRTSLTSSRRG
jgi:hypothetical protein